VLLGVVLFAPLIVAAASTSPFAANPHASVPTVEARLGGFVLSNIDTKLALSPAGAPPAAEIDFAGTLGVDTSANVFRADIDWYFARSHELEASWYDMDLTGRRTLSGTITWDGVAYPVGTTIDSRFRTNVYKLTYGYIFNRGARQEFVGLIGAHVMKIESSLQATQSAQVQTFSQTAPLPALGGAWLGHWSDRFTTRVSLQYFGISIDEGTYSGHFIDFLAAAQYRFGRHWGLGAGYNRFDLNVELNHNNRRLDIEHRYDGALAYLSVEF
jgi:hypothetical protein